MEQEPGSFQGRICDVEQVPGSLRGRICDVEQVPGSLRGRICDVEQAPGSLRGTICDVEQVPWAVAGATDVAVADAGALQRPGTQRWLDQVTLQGTAAVRSPARPLARNIIIDKWEITT